jgi:hypothetical protein
VKTVAIVAAHFVPSNLAAVHRSRLWSLHLEEFGWRPIIVTTHWDFYEEALDFPLMELVPETLEVIRTKALPTRPVRIVGDIGIRAFWWHYRAIVRLVRERKIDFLHITIPSNYSSLLGRCVQAKTGIRYGIDYIDPWVSDRAWTGPNSHKNALSQRLAELLEPVAVRNASLITGINRRYYEGMLRRNPRVAKKAVLAEMPYGGSEKDHEYVNRNPTRARLLEPHVGKFNLVYAGAMLPHGYEVLDQLLTALVLLRNEIVDLSERFHLHFVGTGKAPDDPTAFNIRPRLERLSLLDCVTEYPQRLPYCDVLSHLHAASGVLVLGSTERHYSPSKIFQSVMSRRPVLALLHKQSTAVEILRDANAATLITFAGGLPPTTLICNTLREFISAADNQVARIQWSVLERFSARNSARTLAEALDCAVSVLSS